MRYHVVIRAEGARDEVPFLGYDVLVPFDTVEEVVRYLKKIAKTTSDQVLRKYAEEIEGRLCREG
jgi:hypothetical protein